VTVRVRGDADTVSIEVHNTGPAIDPKRMKTLFDPMSREGPVDDDARLGLGLYIAQQIALAHDGSIEVQSTDQAGTRFVARLPRQPKAATGDKAPG
jgi:signal transduction histidine kinase